MTTTSTPARGLPPVGRLLAVVGSALAVLLGVVVGHAGGAQAADNSRFNAGLIITDKNFTDSSSMSADQIQAFLDARAPSCQPAGDGTPCLRTARFDTTTRTADDRCRGSYAGASGESAAQVIAKVAAACSINPRVILVMLQKEQGLVTASGSSLTATRYRSAMGFGCPDTAACDAKYYGFFNQVYQASWQFNSYALNPTRYSHRAGATANVLFHPDAARCGSAPVYIANQATASLYNYTPYQPNAAALAAGYGTGDSCSSYGNRNFWAYYTDWFGRPDAGDPIGRVEAVTSTSTSISVSGWAMDPATSSSNEVHVYVDGTGTRVPADIGRADVGAAYGLGDQHGFALTVAAAPGTHTVCVYSMGVGRSSFSLLGCTPVTVVDHTPVGTLEGVTATADSITVSGWAWDPDTSDPTDVHVYIDNVGVAVRADVGRNDVAAAYGTAATRGFNYTRPAAAGTHTVCVYAINIGSGPHTLLGCRTVEVRSATPIGTLEAATATADSITVSGWAWDPDTSNPTDVHVYIDNVGVAVRADVGRNDVAAAYGTAATRGFNYTRPAAAGTHTVCVYAINIGSGPHTLLGCRTVEVRSATPIGTLEAATATADSITVSGWAWDPDTSNPTDVHVYIDNVGVAVRADVGRNDVAAAYGTAATRGFNYTRPAAAGTHTVCVYAINIGSGPHTLLGCRTVEVRSATPIGTLEAATATADSITVSGWAWDPDTSNPTDVHVYIDNVGVAVRADVGRNDVAAAYGTAATRGFNYTRPAAAGTHTVCVYAINIGSGPHTLLGCRTVEVRSATPIGTLEAATATADSITVSGWAWDPDTSNPTDVHVYIDNVGVAVRADVGRNDVAAAYGTAATRGFNYTRPAAAGTHTVCVYAINIGSGPHTLLGCRTVEVR